jgi:integrase
MRLSEACGIKVEDVDRKNHTVWIRKRKDPRKKETNDQQVPLLPKAWEIVEPLIEGRDSGQIFEGANPRSVSAAFTRACKRVKPQIIDLHAHDLRHAAITSFFTDYGLDIPHASLLSGHKTWAQLKRYSNLKPSDVFAKIAKGGK